MYEKRRQDILPARKFALRVLRHLSVALALVAFALGIGVLGYRFLEGMTWIDALLNASMILGGMGPVGSLHSSAGKVFASLYALLSGFVFLSVAAIILSPLAHRVLHRFHLDDEDQPN